MPSPPYMRNDATKRLNAMAESALADILGITPDVFELQLEAARRFGVSYLAEDKSKKIIGVSVATSVIKTGDITHKNLIIPKDNLVKHPGLDSHIIVAAFVHNGSSNTPMDAASIPDSLAIAGWIDANDVKFVKSTMLPPTFSTKLPVVAVPCASLHPLANLLEWITPTVAT
jgi:hypothetical protein